MVVDAGETAAVTVALPAASCGQPPATRAAGLVPRGPRRRQAGGGEDGEGGERLRGGRRKTPLVQSEGDFVEPGRCKTVGAGSKGN
eukprot:5315334-Heterocapsa_arctica.AAC.1